MGRAKTSPHAEAPDGVPGPGETFLGGKYRIETLLGVGGMGSVYSATHLALGHTVAVKFIHSAMRSTEMVGRFVREGQLAVKIQSEHVARVLDVGVLDNGVPYLMMEYLVGGDLSQYLEEAGSVPLQDAVDFMLQTCDALAQAHMAGIVHRDLKPSNLFVTPRPDGSLLLKVLDFGISKTADAKEGASLGLTKDGEILGSPLYMSPEQMQNAKQVDARSDIWALGVVFFELLSGRTMFHADSLMELFAAIAVKAPPSVGASVSGVPEEIERAIARCVEKDPADRFQNVGQFAEAIAAFASTETAPLAARVSRLMGSAPPGKMAQTAEPRASRPSAPHGATKVSSERPEAEPSAVSPYAHTAGSVPMSVSQARTDGKNPNAPYIGGAMLLLVLGAGAFWVSRPFGEPAGAPRAAASDISLAATASAAVTSTQTPGAPLSAPTPASASAKIDAPAASAPSSSSSPSIVPKMPKGKLPPAPTARPGASARPKAASDEDLLNEQR